MANSTLPKRRGFILRAFSELTLYELALGLFGTVSLGTSGYRLWCDGYYWTASTNWLAIAGIVALVFAKAYLAWRQTTERESHADLEGGLNVLWRLLDTASDTPAQSHLRITIHQVIDQDTVQQIVNYVGSQRRGGGINRIFSNTTGVVGKVLRSQAAVCHFRKNIQPEAFIQELVLEWGYLEATARTLCLSSMCWCGVPLVHHGQIYAIVYLDSIERNFFTKRRFELICRACSGIALYIRQRYS